MNYISGAVDLTFFGESMRVLWWLLPSHVPCGLKFQLSNQLQLLRNLRLGLLELVV